MSEPELVKVRALDVVPYRWAVWCSIGEGEPFANTICGAKWSEGGEKIWFMLESHNFLGARPEELVELVPCQPDEYARASGAKLHAELLRRRPTAEQAELVREKQRIEARLAEISKQLSTRLLAPEGT